MIKNENFEIIWGPRIQDINVTKCTASWEPSEVSFLSNNDLEQDGPSLESSLYLNMTLRYLPSSTTSSYFLLSFPPTSSRVHLEMTFFGGL